MPIFLVIPMFVIQYGLSVPVFWPAEKITMEKFTSILITDATLNVIWQVF